MVQTAVKNIGDTNCLVQLINNLVGGTDPLPHLSVINDSDTTVYLPSLLTHSFGMSYPRKDDTIYFTFF